MLSTAYQAFFSCRICGDDRSNFTEKTNTGICRTIRDKTAITNAPEDRNKITGKCDDLSVAFKERGRPVYETRKVVICDFGE